MIKLRTHLTRSLEIQPELAEAHFSLAMILLAHGDFEDGWREHDWHLRCAAFDGQAFRSRHGMAHPLRGARFWCAAITAWVTHCNSCATWTKYAVAERDGYSWRAGAALYPLLAASGYDELLKLDEPLPAFDVQVSMLSLPGIIRDTFDTIPRNVPYLRTQPELVERWRATVGPLRGISRWNRLAGEPQVSLGRLALDPAVRVRSVGPGAGRALDLAATRARQRADPRIRGAIPCERARRRSRPRERSVHGYCGGD